MSEFDFLQQQVRKGRLSRREFLGRASALGVTLAAASSLYGQAVRAAAPNKGGHFIIGLVGGESSNSLDPASWLSQVPYTFGKCWGDTLIETSPEDGSAVGMLAESWEGSDDVKTWIFNIRKDVVFHNGKTLDTEDVVATLERHGDAESKSGALGLLSGIDTVKASGPSQVTITLKEANADLPLILSDYHLVIQPGGGKDQPDAGIGTGPYVVDSVEHGVRYTANKNPNYWRDDGYVDSIEVLTINDATARMAALQSGQVHIVNRVEPKTADLLKRAPGIVVENVAGKGHYVFIMHCNTAPFDNNDMRLALKYAMDREAMVQNILQGYGTVGNDIPVNAAYDLFDDTIEQRIYDPEKAAFHYKKAGGGKVLLRTSDVAFPGAIDAAVLYQQQCAKAGIEIEVLQEPGDGYWNNVWNVKPFCTSYWGGRATQDQMYSTAYISTADWNDTRFLRPDFDKIIVEARGELDRDKRKALYREAAFMVRDEGGLILPMFNDWIDAHSDQVQGWVKDGSGEQSNGYAARRCWLA